MVEPANGEAVIQHEQRETVFSHENPASVEPAKLQTLPLAPDVKDAGAGTFVHMSPSLKHSIKAKTPVVMLLMLLK